MFRTFRIHALPAAALSLALAACSAEAPGDGKEVAELRAELQRTRQTAEKQREQISTLERRLAGLAEDIAHVRAASPAAAPAPNPEGAASNAAADPSAANAAAGVAIVNAPAMKAFFESEDGKKTFSAALKSAQDQAMQEQTNRTVDVLLARLGKDANLTEDQSKKMKDILARSTTQLRELMTSMRDGAAAGDPGEIRQKFTDLRTATDSEVKTVLSQTQFDAYQKIVPPGGFGGFGGFGGGNRPRGGGGGGGGGN